MCVIALITEDGHLSDNELESMMDTNPDGFGVSWFNNQGTISTKKSMDRKEFSQIVADVQLATNKRVLVHCRIATHGGVCLANVHPFNVDNLTVFAHNGVIDCVEVDPEGRISDTREFRDTWLKHLSPTWLDNSKLQDSMGEIIGNSKLVFLTSNPRLADDYYIINEYQGEWEHDETIWFSNLWHRRTQARHLYFDGGWGSTHLGAQTTSSSGVCALPNPVEQLTLFLDSKTHIKDELRLAEELGVEIVEIRALNEEQFVELYFGTFQEVPSLYDFALEQNPDAFEDVDFDKYTSSTLIQPW